EVLDGVGLVVPAGPGGGDLVRGLVADVGAGHAAGGDGLGAAHGVVAHLQDVHADVDQRAAALQVLAAEHAPVGDAAAAQRLDAAEHDVAEDAVVGGLAEELGLGVVAVLE